MYLFLKSDFSARLYREINWQNYLFQGHSEMDSEQQGTDCTEEILSTTDYVTSPNHMQNVMQNSTVADKIDDYQDNITGTSIQFNQMIYMGPTIPEEEPRIPHNFIFDDTSNSLVNQYTFFSRPMIEVNQKRLASQTTVGDDDEQMESIDKKRIINSEYLPIRNSSTGSNVIRTNNEDRMKEAIQTAQQNLEAKHKIQTDNLVELEVLGEGTHGNVDRVFDKANRKFYAIKTFKNGLNPQCFREFEILYEINQNQKNQEFLGFYGINQEDQDVSMILELGEGTLQEFFQFTQTNKISISESIWEDVIYQLFHQINQLRDMSIYHRDIKPDNIIITEQGMKLADYSVSKKIPVKGKQNLGICGTPRYMAPELYFRKFQEGESQLVFDPFETDIYSIGLTVIELLGHYMGKSYREQGYQFNYDEISKTFPSLNKTLRRIFEERVVSLDSMVFGSFNEFLRLHFQEYKEHFYGAIIEKMLDKNECLDHEVLSELYLDDQAQIWLQKRMSQLQGNDSKYFDLCLALISSYIKKRKIKEANTQLTHMISQGAEKDNRIFSSLMLLKGVIMTHEKNHDEAIKCYKKALDLQKKMKSDEFKMATIYQNLGIIYQQQNQYEKAKENYQKCLNLRENKFGKDNIRIATPLQNMGIIYQLLKDFDQALTFTKRCLDLRIKAFGENNPKVATTYQNLGIIFFNQKKHSEALQNYQKCLEIRKKFFSDQDSKIITPTLNVANTLTVLGRFNESSQLIEKVLSNKVTYSDEGDIGLSEMYISLGKNYLYQKLIDKGLSNINKGYDLLKKNPIQNRNVKIAIVLFETENYDETLKLLEKELKNAKNQPKSVKTEISSYIKKCQDILKR